MIYDEDPFTEITPGGNIDICLMRFSNKGERYARISSRASSRKLRRLMRRARRYARKTNLKAARSQITIAMVERRP